jgi:hypothetical protein
MFEKISSENIIEKAWDIFIKNPLPLVLYTLAAYLWSVIVGQGSSFYNQNQSQLTEALSKYDPETPERTQRVIEILTTETTGNATAGLFTSLIAFLVAPVIVLFTYRLYLQFINNKGFSWDFLQINFKQYINILLYSVVSFIGFLTLGLVYGLGAVSIVAISAAITQSSNLAFLLALLFIIIAIVGSSYLTIRLTFTQYLIGNYNYNLFEAISKSWQKTKGLVLPLFVYGLICAGITILGTLALFVGLLVAIPVVTLIHILVAEAIFRKHENIENKSDSIEVVAAN